MGIRRGSKGGIHSSVGLFSTIRGKIYTWYTILSEQFDRLSLCIEHWGVECGANGEKRANIYEHGILCSMRAKSLYAQRARARVCSIVYSACPPNKLLPKYAHVVVHTSTHIIYCYVRKFVIIVAQSSPSQGRLGYPQLFWPSFGVCT